MMRRRALVLALLAGTAITIPTPARADPVSAVIVAAIGLTGTGVSTSTGSGSNVLSSSPTLATPSITTSATISSASSANLLFSANGGAVAGRQNLDTGGNISWRNETSGGLFFDAFNGTITFRNYGSGSAVLFRVGTAEVRPGADNTINLAALLDTLTA